MILFDDLPEHLKPESATTILLRKNILTTLKKHYPHVFGWNDLSDPNRTTAWLIDIKTFPTGGVVTIKNLWLSGNMGVTIHLRTLTPPYKSIVSNVGELLERYNIARDKALDVREQILNIPRDFRGEAIYLK